MEARILEHDEVGEGDPPFVLLPGGLTGWQSWPAAWWLVDDADESASRFGEFVARCAGRELSDDHVVEEFLLTAGFGGPEVDFRALPQWEFWSSCRQSLSWCDEKAVRSAEAGIKGFERLDLPTLLIRGRTTAPWLRGVVDILARGMPDAAVVELDGGHACILESPDDFLAALTSQSPVVRPRPMDQASSAAV